MPSLRGLARSAVGLVLAAFVGTAAFGMLFASRAEGSLMAPECGMMGHLQSACPMGPLDHAASWLSVSRAAPEPSPRAVAPAGTLLGKASPLFPNVRPSPTRLPGGGFATGMHPPDLMLRLLSDGIVQPTVYG